jgi:hypothetical protein
MEFRGARSICCPGAAMMEQGMRTSAAAKSSVEVSTPTEENEMEPVQPPPVIFESPVASAWSQWSLAILVVWCTICEFPACACFLGCHSSVLGVRPLLAEP